MLTELFFIINCTVSIVASIIGLIFGIIIIVVVVTHRQCRTVTNLLTCNTSVIAAIYCINNIISSVYGFREDWALKQPVCVFRAYCLFAAATCVSYSCSIQAVGRLFFAVFYKHKYLVTYRVHWCLIVLNWIIGNLLSIPPFFGDGFIFEKQSRRCTVATNKFWTSVCASLTAFLIPVIIVTIIYGTIVYQAHKSSRRVVALASNTMTSHIPNARREKKLVRNILIVLNILVCGGILCLILALWSTIQPMNSPPESFYFLKANAISFAITCMMIALFSMNKQVKSIALGYLPCKRQHTHLGPTHQQQILQAKH